MKKISVNITTYNRAHLLPRCLNSIISQSYKNIEIIIVDDASKDNTAKIIKDFINKNNIETKYFKHQKNMGNAVARNTALKNSTGYYIAFMDDDDEWCDLEKCAKQAKILENSDDNLAAVCGEIIRVNNKKEKRREEIIEPKNLIKHLLKKNGIIHSSTVMFKKNIFDQIGYFDEKMFRGVDSDIYRRIILAGYNVKIIHEPLAVYYENVQNRMTTKESKGKIMSHIFSQVRVIKKHWKIFITSPTTLFYRLFLITKLLLLTIKTK